MTTGKTVNDMLNAAAQAADIATTELELSFVELKSIDRRTAELATELVKTYRLDPDRRIEIAIEILELQNERKAVVDRTMGVINHSTKET